MTAAAPASGPLGSLRADHVAIRVADYQESARWYVDKLGFTEEQTWTLPHRPGMRFGYLRLGGFRLELLGGASPEPRGLEVAEVSDHLRREGYAHLCFHVEDLNAAMAELERRGVPVLMPPSDYTQLGLRIGFVQDNNGNVIELAQTVPGADTAASRRS